jgi:hypothetical protein
MAEDSSIPATKQETTVSSTKETHGGTLGPSSQQSVTPSKREYDDAPTPEGEDQPATNNSRNNRSDPDVSTTPSASSTTAETPKRQKREWLPFHGNKHTRVGSEYQVTTLPSAEVNTNEATNTLTKASSASMEPTSSLSKGNSEDNNDSKS